MTDSSNVTLETRKALFLAGLGVLGFSGTLPATRLAVPSLGAVWMGLGRAVVAALLAAAVLYARREKWPERHQWPGLAVVALGCIVGFPLLSALALRTVPSSHASVVIGFVPLATAMAAVLRGGERPSPPFWAASAFGSAIVLGFSFADGGSLPQPEDALLALASLSAAFGYAEGARLARSMGGFQVIAWALVLAALPLTFVVALAPRPDFTAVPLEAWLGFAYVSSISMFGAFVAWYAGLARAGIARGSQMQLTQPFLTLTWSALLLGETPAPRVWVAASAVVASIAIATRARMGSAPGAARSPGHAMSR